MTDETKQTIAEAVETTVEAAEETVRHPLVRKLARFGFYTKGFLFVVIGSLAILLVAGLRGGRLADASGALAAVAEEPYGKLFLIIFVIGAVGHGVWNILRGAADVDDAGKGWFGIVKRSFSAAIGFFYLGLALSAIEIVAAAGNKADASSQAEETFVAAILFFPLGSVLVALIGLGIVGAGVHECYSGISGKYRENYRLWEITGLHLSFIKVLGIISFTARALLLGVMGYFFIRAAFYNESGAIGLDAALRALLQNGYGRALVLLTAIGLVGHGILAFYEARYRKIC